MPASASVNVPLTTAVVTFITAPGGRGSRPNRNSRSKQPTLPFEESGPVVPIGSEGRNTAFVPAVLCCGVSVPVPSGDGLALSGDGVALSVGRSDTWPYGAADVDTDKPQPADSSSNIVTSDPERTARNSSIGAPLY